MSNTSCTVDMIFSDVTALGDATETNNGSVLSTNSLFKTKTLQKNYGTMELNQFVLNGSKSILPVSPADIAFWSASLPSRERGLKCVESGRSGFGFGRSLRGSVD